MSNPLRPEEERSLHEAQPEVIVPARPDSTMAEATEVVARWESTLGHRHDTLPNTMTIVMTNDVRDRMRDDLVVLINDVIRREHYTA